MNVDTIVTLGNNEKYLLVDMTIQEGAKYFLATKVDDQDNPLFESHFFEEIFENGDYYLDPVTDEAKLNYLGAIFASKLNELLDKED